MREPRRAEPTSPIVWIRKYPDIIYARKEGRPIRGKHFLLRLSEASTEHRQSVSVGVLSGRGFPNAVARNLAKRRLRGCIMDCRRELKPGYRYIFQSRPGLAKADYHNLVIDLQSVISRVDICTVKGSSTTSEG